MRDDKELSRLIDEIGGLEKVIFVALDVEAAVVLPGATPLPLELALVPLEGDHGLPLFHCFLHPGKVEDVYTARLLSCGQVSGCHYIPFKNASFLRRDYTEIAKGILPFLTCERVIFVNKNSPMDVHALVWVFAAAHATNDECDLPMVGVDDIFCFDIDTVVKVLSERNNNVVTTCDDIVMSCWYHSKMKNELLNHLMYEANVHCALYDAECLVNKMHQLL